MENWRIEAARTGRGRCKRCGEGIAEGEQRFGQDGGTTASWYHLRCAAEGAPRASKRFAARIARLLKGTGEAKQPRRLPPGENLATGPLPVLADWLQEQGDPWGTLISLRLARKHAQANRFLIENEVALCGGFDAQLFDWRDGVIVGAGLSGAKVHTQLAALLALRTAARLEALLLQGQLSAALETLSTARPAALRTLTLSGVTRGLSGLRLPRLERLNLHLPASALATVLDAELPDLRALQLADHEPLPLAFLERLADSAVLKQLVELEFASARVLDGATVRFLVQHAEKFAHIKLLTVPYEDWTLGAAQRRTAARLFDARRKLAARKQPSERPFDVLP